MNKQYKKKIELYHGTTYENAISILKNGADELFVSTSKERALTYGDVLIKKEQIIWFDNRKDLYYFNKKMKSDFVDGIIKLEKNKFVITIINGEEEITYFMCPILEI